MNNALTIRVLITYAVLVPLAVFMGYMISDPLRYSTFATIGFVLGVMIFPLLMKWHQPLLLLTWNMAAVMPFVKGQPNFWLLMAAITFTIAILERCLNRDMRFVQVWQITVPLLLFLGVILMTAKLTGGLGLRSMGSEVYGGKKYVFLIGAIFGYFALTAWRIPPEKAKLYVGLFFLGGVFSFIGDLYLVLPEGLHFLLWFFRPSIGMESFEIGVSRLGGVAVAAQTLYFLMLLRYGIRGIFMEGKPWRIGFLTLFFCMSLLGGFRSTLLAGALVFVFLFFLEGLHKTKLLPIFGFLSIIGLVLLIPFASKMPLMIQRAVAILPVEIDPEARWSAEQSSQWRLDMWKGFLPQIPKYLLIGKGVAITQEEYQLMGHDSSFVRAKIIDPTQQALALAGDYHSGPLSVIIPFGIWGAITFLWFLWAGWKVLLNNYRYGDPALKSVNRFLIALFLMRAFMFFVIVGGIHGDMWMFVGIFGLSVALNNGMARKPVEEVVKTAPVRSGPRILRPQPAFRSGGPLHSR